MTKDRPCHTQRAMNKRSREDSKDAQPAPKRAKLEKPSSFTVWPKDGAWTLRAMHTVMTACEASEELKGVAPLWRVNGGFCWPPAEDDRYCPQARTNVDSAWFTETKDTWASTMLERKDVDLPMEPSNQTQFFRVYSTNGMKAESMKLLAGVFRSCGHVVDRAKGFRLDKAPATGPTSGPMYVCGKCPDFKVHLKGKTYQAHYAFRRFVDGDG